MYVLPDDRKMVRNVKTFEISMMIFMTIFFLSNTLFISNHFTVVHSNFITIFQVSQWGIKSVFYTKIRQKVCFSQCFSHKNLVKGLPSLAALHRMSILTQRKTIFQSTTFAYFKGARTREMLSSLLLCKSRTVRCGTIYRLTKAFGGTWIDAVIWQKKVHTGDLFLLWQQIF